MNPIFCYNFLRPEKKILMWRLFLSGIKVIRDKKNGNKYLLYVKLASQKTNLVALVIFPQLQKIHTFFNCTYDVSQNYYFLNKKRFVLMEKKIYLVIYQLFTVAVY